MTKKYIWIALNITTSLIFLSTIFMGYKRFLVWPQIISGYEISTKHSDLFCKWMKEVELRTTSTLKLQKFNYEEVQNKCKNITKEEFQVMVGAPSESIANYSHLLRLGLLYPIVELAVLTKSNIHSLFSILCAILIFGEALLLSLTYRNSLAASTYYLFSFVALSILMNGRMIFAHLSVCILIWLFQHYLFQKKPLHLLLLPAVTLALWMSNVSSGTNLFILLYFIYNVAYYNNLNSKALKSTLIRCVLVALTIVQVFFVSAGLIKNWLYFGGDVGAILNALDHGYGQYLHSLPIVFSTLGIFTILFLLLRTQLDFSFNLKKINPNVFGVVLFAFGGIYGLSIVTCTVPFILKLFFDRYVQIK